MCIIPLQIVERGATESQNVVELHDMYLIDGQLFYLSGGCFLGPAAELQYYVPPN